MTAILVLVLFWFADQAACRFEPWFDRVLFALIAIGLVLDAWAWWTAFHPTVYVHFVRTGTP